MSETINGIQFRDAVISAAENITAHRKDVDELNVFPVPDGDTGTNMAMTINNASRELSMSTETELSSVAKRRQWRCCAVREETPELFFRCFSEELQKGFKGLETADGAQLAAALKSGVDSAYKGGYETHRGNRSYRCECLPKRQRRSRLPKRTHQRCLNAHTRRLRLPFLPTPPEQLPFSKRPALSTQADRAMFIFLRECFRLFATER